MGTRDKKKSHYERGRIFWARLKELSDSGKLYRIENRKELNKSVGASSAWASGLIRRGVLSESVHHFDDLGKPVYRYSLTGKEPDYNHAWKRFRKVDTIWLNESLNTIRSVEITRGDITIKVDVPDWKSAIKVIKDILEQVNDN
jgi:hypothetical protein